MKGPVLTSETSREEVEASIHASRSDVELSAHRKAAMSNTILIDMYIKTAHQV